MSSVSELLSIHDAWPFELFHLHNLQVYGLPALMLNQLRNIPYVITCHGSDILNEQLFDQNFEIAAQVLRTAAAVTCVSQHLADALQQKIPDLNNLHVINNFLRAEWRQSNYPCQLQPQRFLHISSMRAVKRPELLLRVFGQLQRQLPQAQLVIVTTCHGMERVEQMLKEGIHDGTGLTVIDGDAQPQSLNEEYARAQAMVLTSRFEGFGLVVLEALAHHLPVITPAVGALSEVLGEDWPYLVPDQDDDTLVYTIAQAMAQAAQDKDDLLPLRMREILARYDGPKQIAEYAALYREVLL
jgi:glycosyltransferase involved in cell wall biosynthesis